MNAKKQPNNQGARLNPAPCPDGAGRSVAGHSDQEAWHQRTGRLANSLGEKAAAVLEARGSRTQGRGVFSRREFQVGDVIALIEGKFLDEPSHENRARSIQVGHGLFFQASDICLFLNHACDPNARLVVSGDRLYLEAKKDVHVGDEITFHYCTTEFSMLVPFLCNCARCRHSSSRKVISGYHHLSEPEKRSLLDDALAYLKEAPGMAENGANTLQPMEVGDVRP